MARTICYFVVFLFVISCNKKDSQSPTTPNNPTTPPVTIDSYFSDVTTKHLGCDTTPAEKLRTINFVSNADTLLSNISAREILPSDYTIDVPPPSDQDPFNSCVAWATGYGMLSYQYKVIEGKADYIGSDNIFAPLYIYNQLNGGRDNGIQSISFALDLLKQQGCSKLLYMPDQTSVTELPSAEARMNAADYTIESYKIFPSVNIEQLKHFISRGYTIPFAANIDSGFMYGLKTSYNVTPDKRLVYINKSGNYLGKHAMLICGYDDNINAFKILNSWGTGKGNGGFYWIDYKVFGDIILTSLTIPEMYLVIPKSVITKATLEITKNTAVSGGYILTYNDGSIKEKGICYNIGGNPTVSDKVIKNESDSAKYTTTISGLLAGTTYHVKAYAISNSGTKYGNEVQFTTEPANLAAITTTIVNSVTSSSAASGGIIIDDGGGTITAKGVCWSTLHNPTITDNKTNDGMGAGSFISNINGLDSNTTYYVKAYATNSKGTAYGNEVNFTTSKAACMAPDSISGYSLLGTFNGHKYFLSNAFTSWTQAQANAIAFGGHLVTVNSAEENNFIMTATSAQAWIGLTDEQNEGSFVWVTGEPVNYTNWYPGEPNNSGGAENYAIINWASGTWNDFANTWNKQSIIEFDCSN